MDKYEYKIRSEEIKTLIAKGEYADAAAIADSIDWRRVKSVMMLCTISDLYKINRRFEDAREILLLAYDRHPGGRSIVYSLCELCIKMDDFVPAVEYYKEFVQVAPKDSGRFVLQYKLYEAQDVSLEERIEVLEELKAKDYSEKWAYELAYLYHRIGLATKCVEECDELILWFGEGKYVVKAIELKQLHEPLTPEQQLKYDQIKGIRPEEAVQPAAEVPASEAPAPVQYSEQELADAPTKEIPQEELEIQVQLMNVGQYDTINMQKELAQNMKELWEGPPAEEISDTGMIDLPDEETEEELVEPEETKVEEVFFGETGEIDATANQILEEMKKEALEPEQQKEEVTAETPEAEEQTPVATPAGDMKEWRMDEKPSEFDKILGMEYDGQMSMMVPESELVEKQITGQISLEDVLLEWEKMKKDSEQKRMEAVRQHVMQQTGAMFTEFEAATRDGLLEKLEKGNEAVLPKEPEVPEEEEIPAEEEPSAAEEVLSEDVEVLGEESEAFAEAEAPAEEEVLAEAEAPAEEEVLAEAEAPAEEEVLAEEEAPVDEEAPVEEEIPAEEEPSAAEEVLSEDVEVLGEEAEVPAEEEAPVEEETPADEEIPTDEEETVDYEEVEELEEIEEPSEEMSEEPGTSEEEPGFEAVAVEEKVRSLSPEERQLFGAYVQNRSTREQIIHAVDSISLAAYTGNVIITGEEGMDTLTLAKNLIKEVQQSDSNFSGKIAKISGDSLNRKGVESVFGKLVNGALIIQKAGSMTQKTAEQMHRVLDQESSGMIVILEDTKSAMHKLLKKNSMLTERFNIEINVEALDNDSLVAYAKKYAREQEYSIDDFGVLALHTCIESRQTSDHSVTVAEVKEMVDGAIHHANRKTIGHFFDILVAKRYDEEDMIILREKDFM